MGPMTLCSKPHRLFPPVTCGVKFCEVHNYLVSKLRRHELSSFYGRALVRSRIRVVSTPVTAATSTRILVVEDNDDLRVLFKLALTLEGFEVEEARTGLEALRAFENRPPDLVVLALLLPRIDGFAVQQEIAAQVATRSTQIVIVTSSPRDLSHLEVACILRKPVAPHELVATVRRCLGTASPAAGL